MTSVCTGVMDVLGIESRCYDGCFISHALGDLYTDAFRTTLYEHIAYSVLVRVSILSKLDIWAWRRGLNLFDCY